MSVLPQAQLIDGKYNWIILPYDDKKVCSNKGKFSKLEYYDENKEKHEI